MPRQAPTNAQKRGGIRHLGYDYAMIYRMFELPWRQGERPEGARFARHAKVDAFLIRWRSVADFLYQEPRSTDIGARDYLPNWNHTMSPLIESERVRVNKQIAHNTIERQEQNTGQASGDWSDADLRALIEATRDGTDDFVAALIADGTVVASMDDLLKIRFWSEVWPKHLAWQP